MPARGARHRRWPSESLQADGPCGHRDRTPTSALSGGIDDDRTCEEVSVRNDEITVVVGPDDGGAGLNLFHSSLVMKPVLVRRHNCADCFHGSSIDFKSMADA